MNSNNSSANVCVSMLFNTKGAFKSPFTFYNISVRMMFNIKPYPQRDAPQVLQIRHPS